MSSSVKLMPAIVCFMFSHEFSNKADMRVKFEGVPTSMALEMVTMLGRGLYLPLRRYLGTTSLELVAAMNFSTGRPSCLARRPAVRFPKFPEGMTKTGFIPSSSCLAP